MKSKGLLIGLGVAMTALIVTGWNDTKIKAKTDTAIIEIGQEEAAGEIIEITPTPVPEKTAYPDFDLKHLSIIGRSEEVVDNGWNGTAIQPEDDRSASESESEPGADSGATDGDMQAEGREAYAGEGESEGGESDVTGYGIEDSGTEQVEDGLISDDGQDWTNEWEADGNGEETGSGIGDTEQYADSADDTGAWDEYGYTDSGTDNGDYAEPVTEEEPAYTEEYVEPSMSYLGTYTITFYCPCEICCTWNTGMTASGTYATPWYTVASDLPFGTQLYIDGLGYFVVEDRGVSGAWIDVFVSEHNEALAYGLQYRDVYIVG